MGVLTQTSIDDKIHIVAGQAYSDGFAPAVYAQWRTAGVSFNKPLDFFHDCTGLLGAALDYFYSAAWDSLQQKRDADVALVYGDTSSEFAKYADILAADILRAYLSLNLYVSICRANVARGLDLAIARVLDYGQGIPFGDAVAERHLVSDCFKTTAHSNHCKRRAYRNQGAFVVEYERGESEYWYHSLYFVLDNRLYAIFCEYDNPNVYIVQSYDSAEGKRLYARTFSSPEAARFAIIVDSVCSREIAYL